MVEQSKEKKSVGGLEMILKDPVVLGYGLALVCVFAGIVILLTLARSTFERIQDLQAEQATAEQRLTALTTKKQKLEDFSEETDALEDNFALFDRAVPSIEGVPALLTQIQSIVQQSGSEISALQFGGTGDSSDTTGGSWEEVRFALSTKGSSEELLNLLQLLEIATRVIDVESIQYSSSTEETSDLESSLVLVAYYVAEPTLLPDTPITLDLENYTFRRNAELLSNFVPYSSESEVVSSE